MLYYELLRECRGNLSGKVFAPGIYKQDVRIDDKNTAPGMLGYSAERIWNEQDGKVTYHKNRYEDHTTAKVDMEEFLFIKLKAKEL